MSVGRQGGKHARLGGRVQPGERRAEGKRTTCRHRPYMKSQRPAGRRSRRRSSQSSGFVGSQQVVVPVAVRLHIRTGIPVAPRWAAAADITRYSCPPHAICERRGRGRRGGPDGADAYAVRRTSTADARRRNIFGDAFHDAFPMKNISAIMMAVVQVFFN